MSVNIESLKSEFERTYSRPPEVVSEAPGRVNLIGEHTDYNDGFVLPAAIDRSVAIAAAGRGDGIIRAKSLDYDQLDEFGVERVHRFMGSRGWRDYVRGVVWALQDEHLPLRGADIAIAGDIPPGAGLSSSAAVEMAVAGAMARLSALDIDGKKLARLCQRAENLFVGVQCGIMDQLTSALGEQDHALLIDCRSLDAEPVPLPAGISIVIVDSKVPRNLADTPYNRRREECAEASSLLGVASLRDMDLATLEATRDALPNALYRRARHVITENARVSAMADALRTGDRSTIGRLMRDSHESLRADFEVSIPELDTLVALASETKGVIGTRMTGAGFGGCTVNLVECDSVSSFEQTVLGYSRQTGLNAEIHLCRASNGLRVTDA